MCIIVVCALELLMRPYYLISCNPEEGRLACSKMSYMQKNTVDSRITKYISSYLSIYPVTNKAHSRVSTTRHVYFTWKFCFSLISNQCISLYTKSLQSGQKFDLNISNNIRPHVFRSEVGSYFHSFGYVSGLYVFILVCSNFPLTSNMGRCWNIL